MKKTAALVGFGRWGKNIARNLEELGVLHTICDELIPQDHSVSVTTDYSSLLTHTSIKQIFIATPPHTHFALAKQALLAGKDVFVEKPLCLDLNEAKELIELAEEKQLILMVGHILNYHPCIKKIKDLISDGAIGKLRYISSQRLFPGFIREENVLWDLLPHDLSIILSLCDGRALRSCHCHSSRNDRYGTMDTALVTLQFEEISVQVQASWVYPYKEQKLTVIGTEGTVVFDDTKPWPEKLSLYALSYQAPYQKVQYQQIPLVVESGEPLMLECRHFLQCCEKRQTPMTDGREGMSVMEILHTLESSAVSDLIYD